MNVIDNPALHGLLEVLGIKLDINMPTRFNLAPTEQVPVVFDHEGQRVLTEMRWWLVPSWSDGPSQKYAMFNARSETLEKSAAYRGPFRYRRCIIPAASYIEWINTPEGKQPRIIEAPDQALAFAGLWDCWQEELFSCSIVTTAAAPTIEYVHARMPVMLGVDDFELWLAGDTEAVQVLFEQRLPHPLRITAADRRLNNARNKDEPVLIGEPEIVH